MIRKLVFPKSFRGWVLVLTLAGLLTGLASLALVLRERPAQAQERVRPNVVLVTLCSFRFDRLGAAGYWRPLTPYLDSLAAEGVFFENAVSTSSWTKPAAASLITGLTAGAHQLTDYYKVQDIVADRVGAKRTLPAGSVTLAELLRADGYRTMSRVNNVHAGEFFGVTRGFEDARTDNTVKTEELLGDFERSLDAGDGRPFFFWLFTLDAHSPYAPGLEYYRRTARGEVPATEWEYEKRRVRLFKDVMERMYGAKDWPEEMRRDWIDLYDAEVLRLDEQLSRIREILERRGLASSTVIVVTADHGERFFEHGRVDHGLLLDQPTTKIPLIVTGPGIPRGVRVPEVVRSIDVYPTIAELAAVEVPPIVQGVSLAPLLRGERSRWRKLPAVAYAEKEYSLRLGRFNLRVSERTGPLGLFDVESDFLEEHDLSAERSRLVRQMVLLLRQQMAEDAARRRSVGSASERELSPEVRKQLKALGYL